MASDYENDGDWTWEWRRLPFLNDEVEEQKDISFYRRFNVELDRETRQEQRQQWQLATYEDMFGQERTTDHKVLIQLEKLNAYPNELPVLGFNSGKYNLKATKEFLFQYLIQHHPIKLICQKKQ